MSLDHRIRTDIATARGLGQIIQVKLGPALKHIGELHDVFDGYPATASGADTGPRGGGPTIRVDGDEVPVTGVEHHVFRRLADGSHARHRGPTSNLETIADLAQTLRHVSRLLLVELENNAGTVTQADLEALRCKGWGGKTRCPDQAFADARRTDNRCLACGPAEDERRMREEQLRRDRRRGRNEHDEEVA
jgi:hypothetical protein